MVKLIFHKNPERIGGGITELQSNGHRLIIDMGADLPKSGSFSETREANPNINGVTCGTPDCDGVLISHYHGDHAGLLHYVLPNIPIYMSRATRSVLRVVKAVLLRNHLGGVTDWEIEQLNNANLFTYADWGKPHQLGNFIVTPVRQDHSAYDALGFVIQVDNIKIFFTGDFRGHGYTGSKLVPMCQKYVGKVDYILCEGTMLSRPGEVLISEPTLYFKAMTLCQKHKYVLVLASSTNIDTQVSFYRAARASRKAFKVDDFQQQIYNELVADRHSDIYDIEPTTEFCPNGMVLMVRASQQSFIEAFFKKYGQNTVLVYSMWHGYLEMDAKLHHLHELWGDRFVELHTSGHGHPMVIKQVVEVCSTPQTVVIPMHTESFASWKRLQIKQPILKTVAGTAYDLSDHASLINVAKEEA